MSTQYRPLIAHVIYRFDIGGLENGLVNLINHLPGSAFRHAVICLTDFNPEFSQRISRDDVAIYSLKKRPGKDPAAYVRLWWLLRKLKPAIVHTRNIGTIDCVLIAAMAGVPIRIHGEHGWDIFDLHGTRRSYRWLRRGITPLVYRFIALSQHLAQWLEKQVSVPGGKVVKICNGVDIDRFCPPEDTAEKTGKSFVIGSVGRLEAVKDPLTLIEAFILLLHDRPDLRSRVRLAIVGDGSLRRAIQQRVDEARVSSYVQLHGAVNDVCDLMRTMDLFVLPSRNEGISNTILEAMATGLPVVATEVGGNTELVSSYQTGILVPPCDPERLSRAMKYYIDAPENARLHGAQGRRRVETHFSLAGMVDNYQNIYGEALHTMQKGGH